MGYQHSQPSPRPPTSDKEKYLLLPSKSTPQRIQDIQTKIIPPPGTPGPPAHCGTCNCSISGVFSRLNYVLKTADNRRVILTPQVNDKLKLWQNFMASLASRPTHLRETRPHPPTWKGDTDASHMSIVVLCQSTSVKWFVWRLPVRANTAKILLTEENLQGDININDLELAEYVSHLHIFNSLMKPF